VPLADVAPPSLVGSDGKSTTHAHTLAARVRAAGPWDLIVVDPLAIFGGASVEKDNDAATALTNALRVLAADDCGAPTVLVVHHTAQGGKGKDGVRGVTGLVDGARWVATMERPTDKARDPDLRERSAWLRCVKSNETAHGGATALVMADGGTWRRAAPSEIEGMTAEPPGKRTRGGGGDGDGARGKARNDNRGRTADVGGADAF